MKFPVCNFTTSKVISKEPQGSWTPPPPPQFPQGQGFYESALDRTPRENARKLSKL